MLPNCQPNSCRPQAQMISPPASCLQVQGGTPKVQWLTKNSPLKLPSNGSLCSISRLHRLESPQKTRRLRKRHRCARRRKQMVVASPSPFRGLASTWGPEKIAKIDPAHRNSSDSTAVSHISPMVSLKPTASSDLRNASSGVGICPQLPHHLSAGKYELRDSVMPSNLDFLGSCLLFMYDAKENR